MVCCACWAALTHHASPLRLPGALLQTTYDVVIRDAPMLKRFDWSALIIDEGHSLKGVRGGGGGGFTQRVCVCVCARTRVCVCVCVCAEADPGSHNKDYCRRLQSLG